MPQPDYCCHWYCCCCCLVLALAASASAATAEGSSEPAAAAPASEAPTAAPAAPAAPEAAPSTAGPPPAADSAAAGSDATGVAVPSDVSSSGAAGLADARFAPADAGSRGSAVVGRSIAAGARPWNAAAPPPPPPPPAADAGQFHVQTDEGPERYFRYQTQSGQYRKEKRLQDGSVVGSYGWIGADGVLRLRDYVADNSGYRVVRTKSVYVGRDEPIASALAKSKSAPSQGGSGFRAPIATAPPTPAPLALSTPQQEPVRRPALGYSAPAFSFSPPASVVYPGYQPLASNAIQPQPQYSGLPSNYQYQTASPPAADRYDPAAAGFYQNTVQPPAHAQTPFPLYDGIATTQNGFRYYLPRQYQEEEALSQERRAGSFGYIDPFGIRRVVYYNTAPGTGFVHRKNNRYVGFDATPYDPRF